MAHTKGWGASAAIKSDVSGAQVLNVRMHMHMHMHIHIHRVCSLAETRSESQCITMHMHIYACRHVLQYLLNNAAGNNAGAQKKCLFHSDTTYIMAALYSVAWQLKVAVQGDI